MLEVIWPKQFGGVLLRVAAVLLWPLLLRQALNQLAHLALQSFDLLLSTNIHKRLLTLGFLLGLLVLVLQNTRETRLEEVLLIQVLMRLVP